jgi:vanillate/3-O-methylgallate O-demethylase
MAHPSHTLQSRPSAPCLQEGLDRAGSAVALLWQPNAAPWTPEVVEPEYAGWRVEQRAWHDGVTILDLSHHMADTFFEGPDITQLLSEVSANNYENFAVGQAKQFIPVAYDGNIITDGILLREAPERYVLSGGARAQNWVKYHTEKGGYDVKFDTDPPSAVRGDRPPRLFRFQIQGPHAAELIEHVFGGPLPETPFFRSTLVTLGGRSFRALRHGMAGQAGFEFIGAWADAGFVKDAFWSAGERLGIVHVGALAYPTASLESGWIPQPMPAIYTDPGLEDYRRYLSLNSFEGRNPLHGTYYSDDIEDYYVSPYELGYGRSISFNHDFIGRDALLRAREEITRTKVTLVLRADDLELIPADDAARASRNDPSFLLSYGKYRVEHAGRLVGMTGYAGSVDPAGTVLALALVENSSATPGTEVEVVWGEHPGPGRPAGVDLGFARLRATVAPAPFDEHARTTYRLDR